LDRLANERLQGLNGSARSSVDKAVHFEDQKPKPTSKKFDSDTSSDDEDRFLQPVQPSPRKITQPTVSSLVVRPKSAIKKQESDSESESVKAPTNVASKTRDINRQLTEIRAKGQKPGASAIAQGFQPTRQTVTVQSHDDDEDSDATFTSVHDVSNVRRTSNGQPPHISYLFDLTLLFKLIRSIFSFRTRDLANTNPHLSSGDMSQYTYDS